MNKPTRWARPEPPPAQRAAPGRPRGPWRSGTLLCETAAPSSARQEEKKFGYGEHLCRRWGTFADLLQRGQLLFEVVQFLQQLPLLQQVVFGLVDGRVQQMHNVLYVLQSHGMFTGHARCDGGDDKTNEEEIYKDGADKRVARCSPFSGDLTS